jgi:hypothetical protein
MAKYEVAPKKTVWGKNHESFGEGTPVTQEKLGCDKDSFAALVRDGSVIDPSKKSAAEKPEAVKPEAAGADGADDKK